MDDRGNVLASETGRKGGPERAVGEPVSKGPVGIHNAGAIGRVCALELEMKRFASPIMR